MADYYPLIARAIAGLDPSAPGESRRALYERARAALIAQLRGVQPPLSESEITRGRLSLEEAVRKVESEAAQRPRDVTRAGDATRSGVDRARAGDAFRATTRPAARPAEGAPPPSSSQQPSTPTPPRPRSPSPPPSRNERPPLGQEDRAQRTLRAAAAPPRPQPPPSQPQVPMQDPQLPPTRERSGAPRRGPDNGVPQAPQPPGVRGFRDIAADADDLGRAAAQASRSARKTYANVARPPRGVARLEPNMENRGADPDAPYSYDESAEEAERYASPPQAPRPRPPPRR